MKGLTYQPAELANGAVELLDEVAKRKITGEEEALLAHRPARLRRPTSKALQQAFAYLEPGLAKIDPALIDDDQRPRSPTHGPSSTTTGQPERRRASSSTAR